MTKWLQRLRKLTWSALCQLLGMTALLPLIHLSLSLIGYQRTRAWLERLSRYPNSRTANPLDIASARDTARLIAIAGRHGAVTATCLRQSLLLYWLLRRRGLKPKLLLGVLKQGTQLDAHAWVELDGEALQNGPVRHQAFILPSSSDRMY